MKLPTFVSVAYKGDLQDRRLVQEVLEPWWYRLILLKRLDICDGLCNGFCWHHGPLGDERVPQPRRMTGCIVARQQTLKSPSRNSMSGPCPRSSSCISSALAARGGNPTKGSRDALPGASQAGFQLHAWF
eukprot:3137690-Amphidinium_carterae.1